MAFAALRPQAGRAFRAAALLAMLAAALAGCVPRAQRVQAPVQMPEREVERPAPPSRLPADETHNRIAVLVPLTGSNAAVGQSILNAANLALLDTGGQHVRITAYDTAGGAVPAANEALAEGNGLILGPLLAVDVRAVTPIARRAEVPVIAFSNDVSVAGDGIYVMGLNPGQSIDRVIAYAHGRGLNRFGALVPTNVYGERAARAMNEAVEGAGAGLAGIETYDRTLAGMRAAAGRLAARGRQDAVLIADAPRVAAQLGAIIRLASPQPHLLATELWGAESGIGASVVLRGAWFAAPSDGLFNQFRIRYRARYNANPYRLASLGYDAVLLVVRVAADWPLGRPFPARAIRDPGGFTGV